MDQTSSTAAVVVPLAAALGLVGMTTTIALALRNARSTVCPQRARREAAAAAAAIAAAAAPAPAGWASFVVHQRSESTKTPVG